ncbi:MAG: methyltransferase domain-containing protein [Bacteroidota bacterium]
MFATRSKKKELMDDLALASQDLKKNLDELEIINYWLGGNQVIINALQQLLDQGYFQREKTLRIADIGSGGGDLLRQMARWSRKKNLKVQLIGLDANAFMIHYAQERSRDFPEIQYAQKNIFDPSFSYADYDLVTASLFCHHFSNQELVEIFRKAYQEAKMGMIINDLHRHPLAYYGIRVLTQLFRGSYLVKHDAPLSVLRAFKRKELISLLNQANIQSAQIRWLWAFRYQVICLSSKK